MNIPVILAPKYTVFVLWSSECGVTYFLFYVVLLADDHNYLFVGNRFLINKG